MSNNSWESEFIEGLVTLIGFSIWTATYILFTGAILLGVWTVIRMFI